MMTLKALKEKIFDICVPYITDSDRGVNKKPDTEIVRVYLYIELQVDKYKYGVQVFIGKRHICCLNAGTSTDFIKTPEQLIKCFKKVLNPPKNKKEGEDIIIDDTVF